MKVTIYLEQCEILQLIWKSDVFAVRQFGSPLLFNLQSEAETNWSELLRDLGELVDKMTYSNEGIEVMDCKPTKSRLIWCRFLILFIQSCSRLVISVTEHLVEVLDKLSTTSVVFFGAERELEYMHLYGA